MKKKKKRQKEKKPNPKKVIESFQLPHISSLPVNNKIVMTIIAILLLTAITHDSSNETCAMLIMALISIANN